MCTEWQQNRLCRWHPVRTSLKDYNYNPFNILDKLRTVEIVFLGGTFLWIWHLVKLNFFFCSVWAWWLWHLFSQQAWLTLSRSAWNLLCIFSQILVLINNNQFNLEITFVTEWNSQRKTGSVWLFERGSIKALRLEHTTKHPTVACLEACSTYGHTWDTALHHLFTG